MQDIFNKYINYLQAERGTSPYTVRNYTTDLLGFFDFLRAKGISSLKEVDRHILRGYLSHLVEQGFVKASIARKLSAIRSLYRYLVREEILPTNPLEGISSPKLDKRLPSFLTVEETVRLLESPDISTPYGQRDRALLELLYSSGLRISELASLNVDQVNFETNEIRVCGKGSKERVVLIGEPAALALTNYINQYRPKLLGKRVSNALFINRYGGRLSRRRIQQKIEKYGLLANIDEKVHPHLLRHTFATHLLNGGADLRVVQELLGHAQLSSTQIYTHVSKTQARKIYLSAHPMANKEGASDEE